MIKLISVCTILLILGCAQFSGMESESQQGFIPELLLLSSEPLEDELMRDQAQYYSASSRALYFDSMVTELNNRAAKKSYERKALKAKEMALSAEENFLSLSQ